MNTIMGKRSSSMKALDAARPIASSHVVRWLAAMLCLEIATIHVIDQGGLTIRDPGYVGAGYVVLEVGAVAAAIALVVSGRPAWWLLTVGVAAGPLVGYVLSRSVGLPADTDEIGNWG